MFELFEHKADVGVRGSGKTLGEAFGECAKAMFSVMVELDGVEAEEDVEVRVKARNREELLLKWLNELLFEGSAREMLFSEFDVEIRESDNGLELEGIALGEAIDREKHKLKTEVKGASYSGLEVREEKGEFLAQCIVDV